MSKIESIKCDICQKPIDNTLIPINSVWNTQQLILLRSLGIQLDESIEDACDVCATALKETFITKVNELKNVINTDIPNPA